VKDLYIAVINRAPCSGLSGRPCEGAKINHRGEAEVCGYCGGHGVLLYVTKKNLAPVLTGLLWALLLHEAASKSREAVPPGYDDALEMLAQPCAVCGLFVTVKDYWMHEGRLLCEEHYRAAVKREEAGAPLPPQPSAPEGLCPNGHQTEDCWEIGCAWMGVNLT
jgi:hypothetical protein